MSVGAVEGGEGRLQQGQNNQMLQGPGSMHGHAHSTAGSVHSMNQSDVMHSDVSHCTAATRPHHLPSSSQQQQESELVVQGRELNLQQIQQQQHPAGPELGPEESQQSVQWQQMQQLQQQQQQIQQQSQQQIQQQQQVPGRGQFNLSPAEYSRVGPPKGECETFMMRACLCMGAAEGVLSKTPQCIAKKCSIMT